jgi:1-acyl-sn-glycerol-3-phosphate acyltransferase
MNHESALDPVVIMAGLPVKLRSLAKKELFSLPVLGWVMTLTRHIPVDRQNPKRAIDVVNRAAKEIIRRKISIFISPEGTRSKNGELGQFKKGAFRLAERFDLPIIPVTILGAGKCLPTKTLQLRPGVIDLFVDKAIRIQDFAHIDECINYVRQRMLSLKKAYTEKGN